jgi:glycerol-3-phosphate dehydrogenase (NAD(P)+)
VRLGKLLGSGMRYTQARLQMAGETLESVEIITRLGRALPLLEQRCLVRPEDFPLLRHLHAVIHQEIFPSFPWEHFFRN